MLGLLLAYALTCGALGALVGAMAAERAWWLLYGAFPRRTLPPPLPRPWRAAWRYLAPGTLLADIRRLLETGRWT